MMPTQMTIPTPQVSNSPIEPPGRLPPRMENVASIGAMVWPCWTLKIRPRQIKSPPSVTTNDGISR
jgi:hypothetical protein